MTLTTFTIMAAIACAIGVWFVYACEHAPLAEQDDTGFWYVDELGGDHGE